MVARGGYPSVQELPEPARRRWLRDYAPFELYHYRDRHGAEVDLIVETPAGVIAVEVKAAVAPTPAHFKHLVALRERLGDEFLAGVVLNSETSARAGDRLWALPVASLWGPT